MPREAECQQTEEDQGEQAGPELDREDARPTQWTNPIECTFDLLHTTPGRLGRGAP